MPLSLGKIEQDIGKTVDFKREIDCLFFCGNLSIGNYQIR